MAVVGGYDEYAATPEGKHVLSAGVTTRRVAAAILSIHAILLVIIGIESIGVEIPVARGLLSFVYLTFVPGYLLFRLISARPQSYAETAVYVVGLSLVSLMGFGLLINFGLRAVGIADPISELPVVLSTMCITVVLTAVYYSFVEEEGLLWVDTQALGKYRIRILLLSLLPLIAVYGALALTRYSNNTLLLSLYGIIAVIPIFALWGWLPARLFSFAVWVVALSLLLQNTLTGAFLAWGDQGTEVNLIRTVLQAGYWDPAREGILTGKWTMLRIVILHPIYTLFTDLEIVWVYKIIQPVLFSFAPVALYRAYQNVVDQKAALISVYLFMSLFSFYVVLSRNSRTATAVLFMTIFALLVAENNLSTVKKRILALLMVLGIVVSHYGAAYMFFAGIIAVVPVVLILDHVTEGVNKDITTPQFAAFYVSATLGWYIFSSASSGTYQLLINFGNDFVNTLASEYLVNPGETSASVRQATANFDSIVIEILQYYNIALGGIIVLGVALAYLGIISDRTDFDVDEEYLAYATVFLLVFAITFLPVARFNTARTYPITMLFFAPFFVIGIREAVGLVRGQELIGSGALRHIAAVIIIGYFVLNVGLVSAVVADEYSPNALAEKDRITEDGSSSSKQYFYKQYHTSSTVESSVWLQTNGGAGKTVFTSEWPGGLSLPAGYNRIDEITAQSSDKTRKAIPRDESVGDGYVYLNSFSYRGNVIAYPPGQFGFEYDRRTEVEDKWDDKDRIYHNGESVVRY
jgi:uncharacterized membrane protein